MASRSAVVKKIMRLKLKLTAASESATVDASGGSPPPFFPHPGIGQYLHREPDDWCFFAHMDRA